MRRDAVTMIASAIMAAAGALIVAAAMVGEAVRPEFVAWAKQAHPNFGGLFQLIGLGGVLFLSSICLFLGSFISLIIRRNKDK